MATRLETGRSSCSGPCLSCCRTEKQPHSTLSELPAPHLTGDRYISHASVRRRVEFPRGTRHSPKEGAEARYRAARDLNDWLAMLANKCPVRFMEARVSALHLQLLSNTSKQPQETSSGRKRRPKMPTRLFLAFAACLSFVAACVRISGGLFDQADRISPTAPSVCTQHFSVELLMTRTRRVNTGYHTLA